MCPTLWEILGHTRNTFDSLESFQWVFLHSHMWRATCLWVSGQSGPQHSRQRKLVTCLGPELYLEEIVQVPGKEGKVGRTGWESNVRRIALCPPTASALSGPRTQALFWKAPRNGSSLSLNSRMMAGTCEMCSYTCLWATCQVLVFLEISKLEN